MPLFARFRAALGEQRPLIDIPGHLVDGPKDDDDGLSVLVVSMLFLWDCWVFSAAGAVIWVSHDEIGTVFEPGARSDSEVRNTLRRLDVLRE
jgi:hypothetical protein